MTLQSETRVDLRGFGCIGVRRCRHALLQELVVLKPLEQRANRLGEHQPTRQLINQAANQATDKARNEAANQSKQPSNPYATSQAANPAANKATN